MTIQKIRRPKSKKGIASAKANSFVRKLSKPNTLIYFIEKYSGRVINTVTHSTTKFVSIAGNEYFEILEKQLQNELFSIDEFLLKSEEIDVNDKNLGALFRIVYSEMRNKGVLTDCLIVAESVMNRWDRRNETGLTMLSKPATNLAEIIESQNGKQYNAVNAVGYETKINSYKNIIEEIEANLKYFEKNEFFPYENALKFIIWSIEAAFVSYNNIYPRIGHGVTHYISEQVGDSTYFDKKDNYIDLIDKDHEKTKIKGNVFVVDAAKAK